MKVLSQTSVAFNSVVIACTLLITSAEAEPWFSLMKYESRPAIGQQHLKSDSDLTVDHHILLREIRGRPDMLASLCKTHPRRLFQASLFDKQLSSLHCTFSP